MDGTKYRDKLTKFLESGKKEHFKRKETVLWSDAMSEEGYYWITSGYIKVCSYTNAGNERIHYIYGPNDLFPIGWTFLRPHQSVSFVAICDVSVVTKTNVEFNDFIRDEPFIMTEVNRMQLNMHDRIFNLNLDNAHDRVAHEILSFAVRFGTRSSEQVVLDLPLTQQEFADTVRLSRETTGKILNELEEEGYIIIGRKRILVYPEKLSKLLID